MATGRFPILFLAPEAPADAILASGLVKRLLDEAPNASFTIVASAAVAPLFREVPRLEDLVIAERRGFSNAFRLWRRLRRRRWGLILDPAGGGLAGWLPAQQKAVHRPGGEVAHKVVEAACLLKLEDEPPAPFLFTGADTEAKAAELIGEGPPVLAIAPGADWLGAAWPADRYARTAIQLIGEEGPMAGARLLIVGAAHERVAGEAIGRSIARERRIDLTAAEFDPLVVHACLKHARLYLGGAVAWTHMAAAAGVPTLGLYGPADERIEGPWGPLARTVRGPRSFEAVKQADPRLNQPVCHMLDLPVETVLEAAHELLDQTAPRRVTRKHG